MRAIFLGLIAAALLMLVFDRFFFESVIVPSSSMRPTLLPNERVFLQRFNYAPLQRFDVVAIQSEKLGHRIVKRIIGLPGECVELKNSWEVWVNGKRLSYSNAASDESVLSEDGHHQIQRVVNPKIHYDTLFGATPLCLGPSEYYVLGDNRLASGDSRAIGPVQLYEIQGRMKRVWYSYDRPAHRLRTEREWVAIQ
jgi:signal peptidase I